MKLYFLNKILTLNNAFLISNLLTKCPIMISQHPYSLFLIGQKYNKYDSKYI